MLSRLLAIVLLATAPPLCEGSIVGYIQRFVCLIFGTDLGCVCSESTLRNAIDAIDSSSATQEITICQNTEISLESELRLARKKFSMVCAPVSLFFGIFQTSSTCTLQASSGSNSRILSADEASELTFRNLIFQNGVAEDSWGGCFRLLGTVARFFDCKFANCNAAVGQAGGVLYAGSQAVLEFNRCEFLQSSSERGGGCIHLRQASAEFDECRFEECETSAVTAGNFADGGAIEARIGSSVTLRSNCVFRSNTASHDGGAVHTGVDTSFIAEDVLFEKNIAFEEGGALHLAQYQDPAIAPASLNNVSFVDNQAELGGAMTLQYLAPTSQTSFSFFLIQLFGCRFDGNSAAVEGFDVYFSPDTVLLNGFFELDCNFDTVFCDGFAGISVPSSLASRVSSDCEAVAITSSINCS